MPVKTFPFMSLQNVCTEPNNMPYAFSFSYYDDDDDDPLKYLDDDDGDVDDDSTDGSAYIYLEVRELRVFQITHYITTPGRISYGFLFVPFSISSTDRLILLS